MQLQYKQVMGKTVHFNRPNITLLDKKQVIHKDVGVPLGDNMKSTESTKIPKHQILRQ